MNKEDFKVGVLFTVDEPHNGYEKGAVYRLTSEPDCDDEIRGVDVVTGERRSWIKFRSTKIVVYPPIELTPGERVLLMAFGADPAVPVALHASSLEAESLDGAAIRQAYVSRHVVGRLAEARERLVKCQTEVQQLSETLNAVEPETTSTEATGVQADG